MGKSYPEIANELVKMRDVDQAMMLGYQKYDPKKIREHADRLKEIVKEIGWPTISKVGKRASHCAWLLVQHADSDVKFQRYCLNIIKREPPGEVGKQELAYLEDRVRINTGKKQLYGTQLYETKEGKVKPEPLESPDKVNERRKEIGLQTLEEYIEFSKKFYKKHKIKKRRP